MFWSLSILLAVIFVIIIYCLNYWIYHTADGRTFSKIPGPKKSFLTGNMMGYLGSPEKTFTVIRKHAKMFKKLYSSNLFHIRCINIYNPEDFEIVLGSSKFIHKSVFYNTFQGWIREGLLVSKGEKWRHRRKILTPAFHFNILRQFCRTFEEQTQQLVETIRAQEGDVVSVIPMVTNYTLNSLCETAMGTHVITNKNFNFAEYKEAIFRMTHLIFERMKHVWLHIPVVFKLSGVKAEHDKTFKVLHDFSKAVIRARRKERESEYLKREDMQMINNIPEEDGGEFYRSSKKRLAMLDLLLAAESDGQIDEMGIREEVDTFMFEGHDTTGMALTFAMMTLANHKESQEKILMELNEIFGNSNRQATIEDFNNMKYLDMCIKETLRLYPSVPWISRELEESVCLGGYTVPAGTVCQVHIFDLHRDPDIYPDPEVFIPERFTQENCAKRHPFAFVPFSAGPRNCIGQKFAMYELKSVLSRLVRNFILEPVTKPEDIVFDIDIIIRSKHPIYVRFKPRKP